MPSSSEPDLVLDELDEKFAAFQTLRKNDSKAANALLGELGATDDVDRDILLQVSSMRPLGRPDRFWAAHALAMRSLEVLDRNGARGVAVRARWLGPLRAVASFLVKLVTQFIVRNYQASVIVELRNLYARREAACPLDDPSLRELVRARTQADRLVEGYKRNPLGVPTFLLGGAVLSSALSALQQVVVNSLESVIAQIVASALLFAVVLGIGWTILLGAAAARRRINLTVETPLKALYQTIGRCGTPPKDPSQIFALIAIMLILVAGFLVPVVFGVLWLVT